jgi:putative glutathione S-transferase
MGMLLNGVWSEQDAVIQDGAFIRTPSSHESPITEGTIAAIAAEPGRFTLIASMSCPWSQRTLLVRAVKGLSNLVPIHVASGPRIEGYPVAAGAEWTPPGLGRPIVHMHQLYAASDPNFTGRVTVPVLWDSVAKVIVSNDSTQIMQALDAVTGAGLPDFTLRPAALAAEIDELNAFIYEGLSNAVYRAGFAEKQAAYDAAVASVFETLQSLEDRLAQRRYLLGPGLTEADLRLFPTLVRFDAVYAILARCSLRRLVDHPNLWAYARDLVAWPKVADTVDMDALRQGAYEADRTHNPFGIIAIAPDVDWQLPHGREVLGPAQVFSNSGLVELGIAREESA